MSSLKIVIANIAILRNYEVCQDIKLKNMG